MEIPKRIKIAKPSRDENRWYDKFVGEVFTVVGYIPRDDQYSVDALELYDKALVNISHPYVPREDTEPVEN